MLGITGANGKLGSLIIKNLVSQKIPEPITAFVRSDIKGKELEELGVEVKIADYNDGKSYLHGLKGIDTLLLISAHEVGKRVPQHKNVIDAAVNAGVTKLVYSSFVHSHKPDWTLLLEHYRTEELIKASSLHYVICRDSLYMDNMVSDMPRIIKEGSYYTSASNGFAYVSVEDLSRSFAEILARPAKTQENTIFNFTGPELITPEQYFELIQSLTTRKLVFKKVSEPEMEKYLRSLGVPDSSLDGWLGFERMQTNNVVSVISDDIKNLTGKKPLSMTEFIKKHPVQLT